ncbi:restriction endonuclease subunit S [Helicobacter pylori]|uniref:Type I restriction-modification methylase n=1 Tax=Helicobacter pylori TaxID=210 RepID=A0A238GVF5_HELPX|nr:restriction endonuclease subunit S [Helicobacter pylori]SMA52879.1 type I restriction-modification methylase [Helicobacter pylori]
MHKIERLLQTLVPKGVEFRKLGEVINIFKGKQLNKELLLDYGEYPVMNGGIHASGYWNEYNTDCPKIIISQGGASAGYVNYMTSKFWAGAHCYAIELNSEKLNYKFLYYFLKNSQTILMKSQFGAGIPALNKADIETLTIPIPPLEIQQEIVKILDAFTELNTELNARKKQYQYYQNMLLDFNGINSNHKDAKMSAKPYPKRLKTLLQTLAPKGVEFRKLGEVCDFQKGKSITKKAVTFGKVPVISGGRQPAYYHNEANRSGETIAISSSGVYAGYVSYWDIPVFLADSFSVSPKQKTLMPKYLFHYLTTQQDAIHATKSAGGIPHVYSKDLQNFLIPIPPLEIQQEIVKILDQFSLLTTDLLAGIPAEIKARKKQYEYYREKLLAFKPLTPLNNKELA